MTYRNLRRGASQREIEDAINGLLQGNSNNVTEWTLDANQASTTFTHPLLTAQSHIDYEPLTANAAAEKASGNMYVSSRGTGTVTFTHTNDANADKSFSIEITG